MSVMIQTLFYIKLRLLEERTSSITALIYIFNQDVYKRQDWHCLIVTIAVWVGFRFPLISSWIVYPWFRFDHETLECHDRFRFNIFVTKKNKKYPRRSLHRYWTRACTIYSAPRVQNKTRRKKNQFVPIMENCLENLLKIFCALYFENSRLTTV